MIRIQQLKLPLTHSESDIIKLIKKTLKLDPSSRFEYKIIKQSMDARKKNDIHYSYTVDVNIENEKSIVSKVNNNNIMLTSGKNYSFPEHGNIKMSHRPVIVGSGPAGLFCTLLLAQSGYQPLLIERGHAVEQRIRSVDQFWNTGELNPESNVQFGEGGAGTFSDGKLNTLVKDQAGRSGYVLETFVKAGAPSEILYKNKPHIGTDILCDVVKNIRNEIISLGGEVRFETRLTDLRIENNRICGIELNHNEQIACNTLVLALGHSARDTFYMLSKKGIEMKAKAFAVGVRIEHPQNMINLTQYGTEDRSVLPAADYKLAATASTGRGVYSFCMCPGGYVVNASSEPGMLAVNGMSYHARDSRNANSAIIVSVTPDDFPNTDVLAGVEFQRKMEIAAYQHGQGKIPVQLFGDFAKHKVSNDFGDIIPCSKGDTTFADLHEILPEEVKKSLIEGIQLFDRSIPGFARYDAVLSGVESRTSSPVRMIRDEKFESACQGVFPCGEGAGYAGGIMSAAMDGMKIAEAIAMKYRPVTE